MALCAWMKRIDGSQLQQLSTCVRMAYTLFPIRSADAVAKRYRPWPKGLRADSLPWFDSPLVQGASRLRYTDKAQMQRPGHTGRKALATKKKNSVSNSIKTIIGNLVYNGTSSRASNNPPPGLWRMIVPMSRRLNRKSCANVPKAKSEVMCQCPVGQIGISCFCISQRLVSKYCNRLILRVDATYTQWFYWLLWRSFHGNVIR